MTKRNFKREIFFAIITAIIILFITVISSFVFSPKKVFALTNSNTAVQGGSGAELWDKSKETFNLNVLTDIYHKIFQNQDPVAFVKTNKDKQTDSYVIPASTLNGRVGDANNGMVITLDSKKWMLTSLTLANVDGKTDNVIMTLYLADSLGASQFYTQANNKRGEHVYSSSTIRQHLLTASQWSFFNGSGENSFAKKFLVQQKNIKYQTNQARIGRITSGEMHHFPNDSLVAPTTNWYATINPPYKTNEIINGVAYNAWGEDYIWLPSMIEAGTNTLLNTECIWKLTSNQRKTSSSVAPITWLRTANGATYSNVRHIAADGSDGADQLVTTRGGVRPAIHLNLTKILDSISTCVDSPEDLKTTYNMKEQTLSEIVKTNVNTDWYKEDLYNKENDYIKVECPTIKNAGEYFIKVSIKDSWLASADDEIEKIGANNGLTAKEIALFKEKRRPKFSGTPDTQDPQHQESNVVRWIKVTVEKADLDFSNVKWSNNEFEYSTTYHQVTIVSGLPENLSPLYGGDTEKRDVNADGEWYTAKVVGFTGEVNNWNIPTSDELAKIENSQHKWRINKKRIVANWKTVSTTINGVELALPVLKFVEDLPDIIDYTYYRDATLGEQLTIEQIVAEVDMTVNKTYCVVAMLKEKATFNKTNSVLIKDGTIHEQLLSDFITGGNLNKVVVEIAQNTFTYNGELQRVTINIVDGLISASRLIITYMTESGDILDNPPVNVGRYKAVVSLSTQDQKEFIIYGKSIFDFTIQSLRFTKSVQEQMRDFGFEGFNVGEIVFVENGYNNYFEVYVNDELVDENFKFVNAAKYYIKVAFKSGVNTATGGVADNVIWADGDTRSLYMTLDIAPLTLEISGWGKVVGNKRPTLIADDKAEVEKYFDYITFQMKGSNIIGNIIAQSVSLKYGTNYQIYLKVKDQFKGNVFVSVDGIVSDKTEPHLFKTEANPNGGSVEGDEDIDGDSEIDGGGNWNSKDRWFGTDGKLPLFSWVLVGIICLLLLILIIALILIAKFGNNVKNLELFHDNNVLPVGEKVVEDVSSNVIDKPTVPEYNASIINPYSVKNSDWTFVIKESDVINKDLLNAPTEDIVFCAMKKSDTKGLKKLQSQMDSGSKESLDINQENNLNKKKTKKNKKKK